MLRSYPMAHTAHGHHVGYSLKKVRNDPTYTVFYRTLDGRRAKRDTSQTGLERARLAATAIIDEEYAPAKQLVEMVTWDEAARRIKEKTELRAKPVLLLGDDAVPRLPRG
jgi:hypothetical protein